MGKVNSKDYQYLFQYEQQRDFLLSLITYRFDEFRDAVTANDELSYTFQRITHLPEGEFFTSKHAAIGYFKEDVFYSKKRTKRVFDIVTDHLSGRINDWQREKESESDECEFQPQDAGKINSDDSDDERKEFLRSATIRNQPTLQKTPSQYTQDQYFVALKEKEQSYRNNIKDLEDKHNDLRAKMEKEIKDLYEQRINQLKVEKDLNEKVIAEKTKFSNIETKLKEKEAELAKELNEKIAKQEELSKANKEYEELKNKKKAEAHNNEAAAYEHLDG